MDSPIALPKSIKNRIEIEGMKFAHVSSMTTNVSLNCTFIFSVMYLGSNRMLHDIIWIPYFDRCSFASIVSS